MDWKVNIKHFSAVAYEIPEFTITGTCITEDIKTIDEKYLPDNGAGVGYSYLEPVNLTDLRINDCTVINDETEVWSGHYSQICVMTFIVNNSQLAFNSESISMKVGQESITLNQYNLNGITVYSTSHPLSGFNNSNKDMAIFFMPRPGNSAPWLTMYICVPWLQSLFPDLNWEVVEDNG